MNTGKVNADRNATVPVVFETSAGATTSVTAVIDTGFTGALTLPRSIADSSGLPRAGECRGMLADGTVVLLELRLVTVHWDGMLRRIAAEVVDGEPLVGMSLLEGRRLTIDVADDGDVTIEPLV